MISCCLSSRTWKSKKKYLSRNSVIMESDQCAVCCYAICDPSSAFWLRQTVDLVEDDLMVCLSPPRNTGRSPVKGTWLHWPRSLTLIRPFFWGGAVKKEACHPSVSEGNALCVAALGYDFWWREESEEDQFPQWSRSLSSGETQKHQAIPSWGRGQQNHPKWMWTHFAWKQ